MKIITLGIAVLALGLTDTAMAGDPAAGEAKSATCVACHGADDVAWSKMKGRTGIDGAPNDEIHSKSIRKILEKSGK